MKFLEVECERAGSDSPVTTLGLKSSRHHRSGSGELHDAGLFRARIRSEAPAQTPAHPALRLSRSQQPVGGDFLELAPRSRTPSLDPSGRKISDASQASSDSLFLKPHSPPAAALYSRQRSLSQEVLKAAAAPKPRSAPEAMSRSQKLLHQALDVFSAKGPRETSRSFSDIRDTRQALLEIQETDPIKTKCYADEDRAADDDRFLGPRLRSLSVAVQAISHLHNDGHGSSDGAASKYFTSAEKSFRSVQAMRNLGMIQ